MIGELLDARHREYGPVLIACFLPDRQAVVFDGQGNVLNVRISDLSVNWHYDEKAGEFKPDFEEQSA